MSKAILVVDIYDEQIPKELVTAIRFNDGDMLYTETRLISMEDFIEYSFPLVYQRLEHAILYGVDEK